MNMRFLFSLFFVAFFIGTSSAQETGVPQRTMPVISPQKMSVRRFESQMRGLENALQSGSVADINHYYGAVLMHIRTSIQEQEAGLKEGMPVPPALERQRAILAAFDGFEFSKSTPELTAEKMKLLREYGDMKKGEIKE